MAQIIGLFLLCCAMVLSNNFVISILMYRNAQFYPSDHQYLLANLSFIDSVQQCLCRRYGISICFTVNYRAKLEQEVLKVISPSDNATSHTLQRSIRDSSIDSLNRNRQRFSVSVVKIFNRSTVSSSIFDGNTTSDYSTAGLCHANATINPSLCGIHTDVYLTMANLSFSRVVFSMATSDMNSACDPMIISIEGSYQSIELVSHLQWNNWLIGGSCSSQFWFNFIHFITSRCLSDSLVYPTRFSSIHRLQ
jgi:hypothetical protein